MEMKRRYNTIHLISLLLFFIKTLIVHASPMESLLEERLSSQAVMQKSGDDIPIEEENKVEEELLAQMSLVYFILTIIDVRTINLEHSFHPQGAFFLFCSQYNYLTQLLRTKKKPSLSRLLLMTYELIGITSELGFLPYADDEQSPSYAITKQELELLDVMDNRYNTIKLILY